MLRWPSTLFALTILWAPALAQQGSDRNVQLGTWLDRARSEGDRTPSETYYSIAQGRDAQAFAILKDALKPLADPGSIRAAYGACALFKGSAIEESVRNWLAKESFKAEPPSQQIGATLALTYFWRTSEAELSRIVSNHPSKECREFALQPLLPALVARGDRSSARMILENMEPDQRSQAALRAALRQFRDMQAETYLASALGDKDTTRETRLMLLDLFAERDTEVAHIAIERRLSDEDEVVRLRAIDIMGRNGDPAVFARLRTIAQKGSPEFVIAAMVSLADKREGDPAWVSELYSFTQSQSMPVRLGAISALGRLPTQDSMTLLHRLTSDKEIDVQLAALQQIGLRRQLQSVPKLIAALGDPRSLVTHEVARQLRLLTGEDHGVSQTRWSAWFETEGATLQLPTFEEVLALENARNDRKNPDGKYRTASFYGLKIESTRICFVLDTSGSMADAAGGRGTSSSSRGTTRMNVAKQELSDSLNQLLNGVKFNIVTFSNRASAYQSSLIELDDRSRAAALKRIENYQAGGGTAIYDGLLLALKDKDVDTIFLLTDGDPTEGAVVEPALIRAKIEEMTRYRDLKIHGVAVGKSSHLLRGLAKDSGGQYVEIF